MVLSKPWVFNTAFDRYTATAIVGEGGSARVFKAADETGQPCAVKLLPSNATKIKLKRFEREYIFGLANDHPNVVKMLDQGVLSDGSPFVVMPLYSGSLRTLLQPGIDPGDVIRYFAQLLDGVECAHLKNVVHRDLKPENVLYDQTTDRLVLADFGIAHFSEDELFTAILTKDNERLANHRYAAPEQETRGLTVDKRADIFALGLILNEMFTGEIPKGSGYKTIEGVSSEYMYLDAIVDHMIRQSPGERPSDIEDVKRILRVREDEFITSQRVSSLSQVVVPVSQLDDSLISDPIQLVDKDWDRGRLNLILNQAPNEKWVWHFKNQGNYSSLGDYPPEIFDFRKNNAIVNCPDTKVQQVIDYFKPWLSTANDLYKKGLNETFD